LSGGADLASLLRRTTSERTRVTIPADEPRARARPPTIGAQMRRPLLYSHAMPLTDASTNPRDLAPMLGWRRVRITLIASTLIGLLDSLSSLTPTVVVVGRAILVGLFAMLAFGLVERWPKRLPRWVARWVLQLVAIVAVAPFAALLAYWLTTGGNPNLAHDELRLAGYVSLTFSAILFAPWIAVGAMVRQRDDFARNQATAFALERSELERKALDARFRLLQAQIEPHFLFNTLANVQALVEAGAPQASKVLQSLIAYLRAAVPRLHESTTNLDQELQLVKAYLEVMHMRMPDRLQYEFRVDEIATRLQCPPMTLLTLVENAVRHGIDPSEVGGRIEIEVRLHSDRCFVRVTDTGVGLQSMGHSLGTGLAALRERLQLAFGGDAQLHLSEVAPHGVRAELSFPARRAQA
jgi:two-component sensor histidine kinase